jgi:hypothetical protein
MTATAELSHQIIKNLKRHSCAIVYGAKYTGKTYLIKYAIEKELHKKSYEINCRDKPDINRNKLQNKLSKAEVIVFENAEASSEIDDAIIDLMVDKSVETIMLYNGTKEEIDAQFSKTRLEERVDDSGISMPPLNERKNEMLSVVEYFTENTFKTHGTTDGNRIKISDEVRKFLETEFHWNIDLKQLQGIIETAFLSAAAPTPDSKEAITMDDMKIAIKKNIPEIKRCKNYNNNFKDGICSVEVACEHFRNALHRSWININRLFIIYAVIVISIASLYWYDLFKITFDLVIFLKCILFSVLAIFGLMSLPIFKLKKFIYGKNNYREIKDVFED